MIRVLVTGASGFIGRALCAELQSRSISVSAAIRNPSGLSRISTDIPIFQVGEIGPNVNWRAPLRGITCVVHTAGLATVPRGPTRIADESLHRVNVAGSRRLAMEAARAGVRRFIFISSIRVHGVCTAVGRPFCSTDTPAPIDAYAKSKLEAENSVREVCSATGLELVVVRPPLVYGLGAVGNIARLTTALRRGIPLPFAAVRNRRSYISIDNLVDLLISCCLHSTSLNGTFLVRDGIDLSLRDFLQKIGAAMGRPARLVPVPVSFLLPCARAFGLGDEIKRLIGNLEVDDAATRKALDWQPPFSVEQGVARMVGEV